jgi:NADPH-dependent curcumin reductase CurA
VRRNLQYGHERVFKARLTTQTVYNDPGNTHFTNWFDVIAARLTIQGFLLRDYLPKASEGSAALRKAVEDGHLTLEGASTEVQGRFEDIPSFVSCSRRSR